MLSLVSSLAEEERTIHGIAERLGVEIPTAYHLLNTLVDARLLAKDELRRYHLGAAIGTLATAYYQQALPPSQLVDPLRELSAATGHSVHLTWWRFGDIEVAASFSGTRAVHVAPLAPGVHGFGHARASGKVLLAFAPPEQVDRYLAAHPLVLRAPGTITDRTSFDAELQRVRGRGFATAEEEFREGVACISVPLLQDALILGAYTISVPIERYASERDNLLAAVARAASDAVQTIQPPQLEGDRTRIRREPPGTRSKRATSPAERSR